MRVSFFSRVVITPLLLGAWFLWSFAASQIHAQGKNKLPDMSTPQAKMRYIQSIRDSFPALKTSTSYDAEDLSKSVDLYVAKATSLPFRPLVSDEVFARRVYLDLTGVAPDRTVLAKFVADKDKKKRSALIDELLATDAFARKQARYWRSVIFHESPAPRNMVNPQAFEDWLYTEFKKNTPWDLIVAEMIAASPDRVAGRKPQDNGWNQNHGPNNFILANERKPEQIAAESARIFMGISIGCAECHDHPFEDWKREQFHELAAFYAPGKYFMTDQDDLSKKSEMQARFLLGEKPPEYLKGDHRRVAMAGYLMYNPKNYWFARAYVNRVWSELIGDGFYAVDSLGPDKEVQYQFVVNRLSAQFRFKSFDTRWLYSTIMNTDAYQREIATIDKDADLFTAVRPTRLRPYDVAESLTHLFGDIGKTRQEVYTAFDQNPSRPQRDLEGSMQQALLLMNNATLQQKLANSPLLKELKGTKSDEKAIQEAFMTVLARTPTPAETARYISHIKQAGNRNEALEDIVWVLVNSAEFVTRR
ncbi:MAG: DUF1549 domain-containing protein [Planctomycetaceae bacterium]